MVSKLFYWDILVDPLYPVYNKLIQWSTELDTNNVIWEKRNDYYVDK